MGFVLAKNREMETEKKRGRDEGESGVEMERERELVTDGERGERRTKWE